MKKVINTRIRGPESEVLDGCRKLVKGYGASCVVADAEERAAVMRSYLRPPTTSIRFVGHALTVRLESGNQVDCLDALAVAQRGGAAVVDAIGETETSIWGGLTSGLLPDGGRRRGCRGRRHPRHRRDAGPRVPDRLQGRPLGSELDRILRESLAKADLDQDFRHVTGHGIGLRYHGFVPMLTPGSQVVLEPGMYMSVEPGVYIPGFGGSRIDDNRLVGPDRPVPLSTPRKPW